MRMRPTSVAAPVAMTTGRKVRLETSGSRISIANSTPPSGVLKVAAMPAPAPAESRVIFWPGERPSAREKDDPSAEPIWMIGPSRPTDAPRPDRKRGGERLDDRDDAANVAALVVDGVHHLRDAVTLGFGREALHEKDDDKAAEDRRQDDPVSEPARPFEDVGVIDDAEDAVEHGVVDEADQRAQRDRADPGHDPDPKREQAEDGEAHALLFARRRRRLREGRRLRRLSTIVLSFSCGGRGGLWVQVAANARSSPRAPARPSSQNRASIVPGSRTERNQAFF